MRWQFISFLLILFLSGLSPAEAREVVVKSVIDGMTFETENGEKIRLAGIEAPYLSIGTPEYQPWPLASESRAYLDQMIQGQTVILEPLHNHKDRYGSLLAHAYVGPEKIWVQGEMLKAGMARVQTYSHTRLHADRMLALESQAIAAQEGIWENAFYRIIRDTEAYKYIGEFRIVTGRIQNVTEVNKTIYMNFGLNWQVDFTVAINRDALSLFAERGLTPQNMTGRTVMVRGWLREYNGPLIDASHPEQIQFINP